MTLFNLLLICCVGKLIDVFASSGEKRLVRELFINRQYDPIVRPVAHTSQRINVTIDLQLFQLISIDEKLQSVEVSVWFRQAWTDTHLTWNPADYDGIESFITNPEKVWKPDIVLYNNIRDDIKFGGKLDQCLTRIQISSTGAMYWMCPVILRYTCKMEMKYFPFDTQTCYMKFGSWGHDMSLIDLKPISETLSLGNYMLHNGWNLASTRVVRNELKYDCCVNKYVDVTYYLTLQRRSLFYIMNLALPIAIISGLTVAVFILPEESGERLALSTTLMLAVTVFMLLVAETTPATSDAYPLISVYFTTCMLIMFVMIVILCVVSSMYNKNPGDGEMGHWLRRYVLDKLSYSCGIRRRSQKSIPDSSKITISTSTEQNIGITNTAFFNDINYHDSKNTNQKREDNYSEISRVVKTTNEKVDDVIRALRRKDADKLYKEEWRLVAKTIDTCLFFVFSFIFVVTTVGSFSMATYVS